MSKWTDKLPESARDWIAGRRVDEVECIIADIAGAVKLWVYLEWSCKRCTIPARKNMRLVAHGFHQFCQRHNSWGFTRATCNNIAHRNHWH
jgi:hypothetical protein